MKTITIRLNGQEKQLELGTNLLDLLQQLQLNPQQVVVERNRIILERSDYENTCPQQGDQLEIIHFVGGG